MKKVLNALITGIITLLWCSAAFSFTSGSTGADGAFSPAVNTEVQLPESGILNYTTVNVPSGVTVTFKRNTANTPVFLLATGNVTIAGTISVNGKDGSTIYPGRGGPGGFDGGMGGNFSQMGGKGIGPGGGNPGSVSTAQTQPSGGGGGGGFGANGNNGNGSSSYSQGGTGGFAYGNTRIIPMTGGSGGAGGAGTIYTTTKTTGGAGGGGGGSILIASSGTITVTGSITANGGKGANASGNYSGCGGGGSGGAIKLMANSITGEGAIAATSGAGGSGSYMCAGGAGSAGRIHFEADVITRSTATNPQNTFTYPGTVFVTNIPTLRITSVGGISVPASPSGQYGLPDVVLPTTITNPVTVNISGANIPIGTQVTLTSAPQSGSPTSVNSTLTGTDASSTASVSVTISTTHECILLAQATFVIQQAMYWEDERIEKVRVAATMDGTSDVVYITEKGREIKQAELMAAMIKK